MCTFNIDEEKQFLRAAKDNNVKVLNQLLKNGVDVNCRHPLGWNALHTAVINGHSDIIRLLIKKGADVNAKDEFSSAIRIASQEMVSSRKGSFYVLDMIY